MSEALPAGKLPPALLSELLQSIEPDPSVVIGPGIGRDAAAVRVGDQIIVLKTDPITFATDEIGWYAPNVNANDIACMGATPRWMLVTALLPEHQTTPELVRQVFADLRSACNALGVSLIGGHTEITVGLDRTMLVGMMAGQATEDELIDPRTARPGDALLLARGIAIEGTALLAQEFAGDLSERFGIDFVERCRRFLHEPGISVVHAAKVLRAHLGPDLHALHDPTEGGLATGVRELAEVAGCGARLDHAAIPIYPETETLCQTYGIDPLGLISSGALLAVVEARAGERAVQALRDQGIPGAIIGYLDGEKDQLLLDTDGHLTDLPFFAVDELARLLSS